MQSKSLLIAIAAFAVTATGVHAYSGTKLLSRAGLSDKQISAMEEANELRAAGDIDGARNRLIDAGITETELLSVHHAAKHAHAAMHEALTQDDFESFMSAIADMPLADIITTHADYEQFREAYQLRAAGEEDEATELFAELGLDERGHCARRDGLLMLSDEQRDAFMVAKQSNDRATMQAILDEAGVDR
jgi:hypothetical protein